MIVIVTSVTVVSVSIVIVIIVGGCDDRDRGDRFRDDCMIGIVTQMTVTVVSVSIVIVIIVGGCDDRDRDDRFHDDCVIVIVTQMTVMIVIVMNVIVMIVSMLIVMIVVMIMIVMILIVTIVRVPLSISFRSTHLLCSQGVLDKSFGELFAAAACLVGPAFLWVAFGSGPLPGREHQVVYASNICKHTRFWPAASTSSNTLQPLHRCSKQCLRNASNTVPR